VCRPLALALPPTRQADPRSSPDQRSIRRVESSTLTDTIAPLAGDNFLTDLAARIRAEHGAAAVSLGDAARHAIAAGELLIEAKALVRHGQWLPWLRDHCSLSERTCQLYMRCAKNRAEIEAAKSAGVADLTLNEAAALLMLSSDVRKLLNFARTAEGLSGEALVEFCIANNVAVIKSSGYNAFAGRSEAEKLEWMVFTLFLSYKRGVRGGLDPDEASAHVEYLLQRPFQNVDEWLGPDGDDWRRRCGTSKYQTEQFKTAWAAFRDAHRPLSIADIEAESEALRVGYKEAEDAGVFKSAKRRRRRAMGR
jgi:hypothetical protein